MTSKSDKIRGLFLSALMVMSVFAGTMAFAGAASAQAGNVEKGQATYLSPNSDYWAGVSVFNATNNLSDSSTEVQIMEAGGGLYDTFNTDSEGDIKFSTEGMDGTYYLESGGSNVSKSGSEASTLEFTVRSQDLTASFEDDVDNAYETDTNLTLESKRINYGATIEASGLSTSELQSILRVNTGETEDGVGIPNIENETIPTNFTGIDAGNYTFSVEVNDTGAVSEATVNVSEGGDAQATFASGSVVSQERGDVAEVTLNLSNTQQADVTLGSADVNWKANFTVNNNDDDNQVTLQVNTYKTDSGAVKDFVEADGEDTVTVDSGGTPEQGVHTEFGDNGDADAGLGNPIATGQYEMITGVSGTEQDVSQLSLSEGFVDSAQVWERPDTSLPDAAGDLVNDVAEDDTLAVEDLAVVEFSAAGLYGNESLTQDYLNTSFSHNDSYSLNVTQTNPGANADPNTFDGTAAEDVYFDSTNNSIYAVFDTDSNGIQAGDEYDAEFTVHKSSAVTDEARSANATFSVEERTLAFNGVNEDDVLNVSAGNATVEGETSAATGTEFTVQVQSDSFVRTSTATVDDGTFSADFDFSDVDTGTELTISASTGDASANVDGLVVESVEEEPDTTTEDTETTTEEDDETTTTEEPDDTTTTEASDDEDTTEDGDEGDEGDEGGDTTTEGDNNGGIPGFGMAVSLVALVAAALLALRRSN